MKIFDAVKEHPYVAAGGVFVLGVILIVILFGGKSTAQAVAQTPTSDTQSATQLTMAQLAAQVQTHASDNALLASNGQTGAAVSIAQLQAATQQNSDLLTATTAQSVAQITATQNIGVATLAANVQQQQIAAAQNVALKQIDATTNVTNYQTLAGLQGHLADDAYLGHNSDNLLAANMNDNSTKLAIANLTSATVQALGAQAGNSQWLNSATLQALASQNTDAARDAIAKLNQSNPGASIAAAYAGAAA